MRRRRGSTGRRQRPIKVGMYWWSGFCYRQRALATLVTRWDPSAEPVFQGPMGAGGVGDTKRQSSALGEKNISSPTLTQQSARQRPVAQSGFKVPELETRRDRGGNFGGNSRPPDGSYFCRTAACDDFSNPTPATTVVVLAMLVESSGTRACSACSSAPINGA